MANVSGIEHNVAELYYMSAIPGHIPGIEYETGWFGSKIAKAVGKAAKGVVKVAVAPITHTVKAASDIAHGKNVLKSVVTMVKSDLSTVKTVAPYAQMVASLVPGVGSAVSGAIGAVSATIQGKSLADIAKSAASGAIPGGPLMVAAVSTVGNMVAAGVQGQNIAKAAAHELAAAAASMVPNAQLANVLKDAANAGINGQNMLKSAKGALIQQALNAIPDASARAAAAAVVSGKSPTEVVKAAGAQYLTKVAAAGLPGTSSIVQGIQKAAQTAKQVQAMGPSLAPQLRALRPSLPFAKVAQRTLQDVRKVAPGVVHRPLTSIARNFINQRAGAIRRDVSGLTPDGKWLVVAGDTGEKIALAVVGNKARWTELKAANPTLMKNRAAAAAKYGFPIYANDVINLPGGWVKATVVPTPVATPAIPPAAVPTGAPMGQPVPQIIMTSLPTVVAPSGDTAAQMQARALLAAWGKTDGITSAGMADYGGLLEIGATNWSARDVLQAASFQNWWNRAYKPSAPFLITNGAWNQSLNDALHDWSEHKAAQVLPAAVLPTVLAPQAQPQSPPVIPTLTLPAGTIPASGGTPPIQLPGLIITGNQTPAQSAPAQQTSEPAKGGIGEWWSNNKGAAIPGLLGLGVTVASKYI